MKTILSSLLLATFLSTASFSAEHEPEESSEQGLQRILPTLEDYNVDKSLQTNPAYKMVKPVIPLIVEPVDLEVDLAELEVESAELKMKALFTKHTGSRYLNLRCYITPHAPQVTLMVFEDRETFPSEAELKSLFSLENQGPFINCSFGIEIEPDINGDNYKRFIDCALESGKILIFGAGDTGKRTTDFLSQLQLNEAQKRQILFVGALSPTADNKQKPSLYSATPGKSQGQFLWAMGTELVSNTGGNGTSLAAPRVTGLLCRLMGTYPQLNPQEAMEIVCLTASKSPFISTNNPEIDEYLYAPHGAIDPMAALQFAAEFLKLRTEGQSPNSFFQSQQINKSSFQSAKTLRQKLDLMNFLENHHFILSADPEEIKVHGVLKSLAEEINLDELYAQPQEFFTPDDLYALRSYSPTPESPFESFIKKNFPASIRDSLGFTPLHLSANWGHMNLVRHYVKALPDLINDHSNFYDFMPIASAILSDNLNPDIISFLLEKGANPYAEDINISRKFFAYAIAKLYLETSKEQAKKAVLSLIQHKTFDPHPLFIEKSMEKWAQEIELEQKYPEIYHALIKAMTKERVAEYSSLKAHCLYEIFKPF